MIQLRSAWIVRGILAFALIATGYCAVARNLAIVASKADPMAGLKIWDDDARIASSAAQAMIEKTAADGDQKPAAALARQALMRDGTAVLAVDVMGFTSAMAGNEQLAAKWFGYSESLSRRDLRTQLYFIERSVAGGDIAKALYHYDIALRTSDVSAPTTLFPILRGAVGDPNIRRELVKTLSRVPIWSKNFLTDIASNGPDFAAAATLFVDLRKSGFSVPPETEGILISNLIAHKDIATAWQLYATLHPQSRRAFVRNGEFQPDGLTSSPFDWQLSSDNGISGTIGVNGDKGILEYRLAPTTGGAAASQIIFLPPGKYRLTTVLLEASQKLGDGPSWKVACVEGPAIGSLEMGGPLDAARSFSTEFEVPAKCAAQSLVLVVQASDDIGGATGQIDSVVISRIQ